MEWPIRASAECGSSSKTLRYLAVSTVIVAAALLVLTSLQQARDAAPVPRYATAGGTPGPPQNEPEHGPAAGDMYGDAPWALSALPECFRQTASASGSPAFVKAKIPVGARVVRPGTALVSADCGIEVRPGELRVRRGADRLRVPPPAQLYELPGGRLMLDRHDGAREEVRFYLRAGAF